MTDMIQRMRPWASWWRPAMWSAIAALLLLPLVAMRFTQEVAWGVEDFVFALVLLGGAGIVMEVTAFVTRRPLHRVLVAAFVLAAVLVIWAQAAVGIL